MAVNLRSLLLGFALFLAPLLLSVLQGCSCGVEGGMLDTIRCDTENDCLRGEECLGGYCHVPGADGDADADSDGDGDGDGPCALREVQCPDGCFDLSTDANNCGRCGHSCGAGSSCDGGECTGCDPGLVSCGGAGCFDLSSDRNHCGACDTRCAGGAACSSGQCACPDGLTSCGGGSCRDTNSDPMNCGGCGADCAADEFCDQGDCACRPGLTDCGGRCVSLQSDPANCGACGTPCGNVCQGGHCLDECNAEGLRACDGACTNTQTDPLNCGGCGETCAADELCISGNCRNFQVAIGCDSCPCDGCRGDFGHCCTYPGGALAVCVDSERCP